MIRSDMSPPDIHVGSTLRRWSRWPTMKPTTAQLVEERGNDINKSISFHCRARRPSAEQFPPEDRVAGKYLATLVRQLRAGSGPHAGIARPAHGRHRDCRPLQRARSLCGAASSLTKNLRRFAPVE
jgi:hypothetical protein